ncbi:MAG: trigger factor [Thermodesulfovibrionales bacterium]|nr:trigger factor [Thermodesulfovibrionales bacterium]
MLKNIEHVSKTKKLLSIEIAANVIEDKIQSALKKAQKDVKLPGFRPGKVPINIIEKRYGKSIEADVLEELIKKYFDEAIKEAKLNPVSLPQLEGQFEFQRKSPLNVTFKIDVRAEVENLKYDDITIKDVPVNVTDEDVMRVIEQFAKERANYEASDEPAEDSDLVTFDCKSENDEKKDVILRVGSSTPYPEDFTKAFIGKKVGDQFEYEADFTDNENLPLHNMKGKVTITINTIKKRKVPSLDDEFAKDLGYQDFKTLTEQVKENITNSRTNFANNEKIKQILDKLIETYDFELPESQVEAELSALINKVKPVKSAEITDDDLREKLLPEAKRNVKIATLIQLIGEKENIVVSKEQVEKELYELSSQFNVAPEELLKYYMDKDGSLIQIYNKAYTKAVFAKLLEKVKIIPDEGTIQQNTGQEA